MGGAAIAQWICLRLPSCRPGFESQAHHLCFHQFIKKIVYCGKDENKQKRGRDRSIFKSIVNYFYSLTLVYNFETFKRTL